MDNVTSVMMVGVGGQGSLLASRILGGVALRLGYDVKASEVHGMSQRGGSVVTYLKYGGKVYSPVICRGEAEIILAFEQLEALRWLPYLKKGGTMIMSAYKVNPAPVMAGAMEYPEGIAGTIAGAGAKVIEVDAFSLAVKAGTDKAANVAVIGVLAKLMEGKIGKNVYIEALRGEINPEFFEANLAAFNLGYDFYTG